MSPIYGIWNVAAFIYDIHLSLPAQALPPEQAKRFQKMSFLMTSKWITLADLKEMRSPPLCKQSGKLCHTLWKSLRRKGVVVKNRFVSQSALPARSAVEGRSGRLGLGLRGSKDKSPNNASSSTLLHATRHYLGHVAHNSFFLLRFHDCINYTIKHISWPLVFSL